MKITSTLCVLALLAAGVDAFLTLGSLGEMPARLDAGLQFKLLMDLVLCGLVTATVGSGRRMVNDENPRTRGTFVLCTLTCVIGLVDVWLTLTVLDTPAVEAWAELRRKLALDAAFATLAVGVSWSGLAMVAEIQQQRARERARLFHEMTTQVFMQPLRDELKNAVA